MSHQLIVAPDDTLVVWSTVVDDVVYYNISDPDEYARMLAQQAYDDTYKRAMEVAEAVCNGRARDIYFQFTMTFDEMQAQRVFRHGEPWKPMATDSETEPSP